LSMFGPNARDAVPVLFEMLDDRSGANRSAAMAIVSITGTDEDIFRQFVELALGDGSWVTRTAAIHALAQIANINAAKAPDVLEVLWTLEKEPTPHVFRTAIQQLLNLGQQVPNAEKRLKSLFPIPTASPDGGPADNY
jgi:HEAT repeat protein